MAEPTKRDNVERPAFIPEAALKKRLKKKAMEVRYPVFSFFKAV